MRDAFLASLPADATVLEAGAYHGEDTIELASRCAHVHAFEPVSYSALTETAGGLPNVTTWNYALGDRGGVQTIWVSGGPHTAASSLLAPKEHTAVLPEITFGEQRGVKVVTLNDWAARYEPGPIHGLWLDLQGMELAALKTASRVLKDVRSILLEVSHAELYERCPLWPEVRAWLMDNGFRIAAESKYPHGQSDVLAVAR